MQNTRAYIDEEVVQRVCKLVDCGAISATTVIFADLANPSRLAPEQSGIVAIFGLLLAFLVIMLNRNLGLYRPQVFIDGPLAFSKSASVAIICGTLMLATLKWIVPPMGSDFHAPWIASMIGYFAVTRFLLQLWAAPLAVSGCFRRRIAIVGGGKPAEDAIAALESSAELDVEIVGIFDDRADIRSPGLIRRARKIGKIADLAAYARQHRVDLIIVAIPFTAEARLLGMLKRLWEVPVDIRISGPASALQFGSSTYGYIGKLPVLPLFDRPLKGWGLFIKSIFERTLAGLALLAFSPVMIAIAIAVKLESKGPAIFRQQRYGFNNELIEVYKFRSMYVDRTDAHAAKLVTKDDPRVTCVGRFIRKTSLDELPQLINVLTGQLSLVGPRPHATQAKAAGSLYEQVVDGYFARHKVRPGITGWAQVNGWRGETDTREKIEQRVKHDLEYIDRWSLLLDLKIILRTPLALVKGENAY
jgi:Undecaprenyl-phosphate glucose phosphotransferase